MTSPDRTVVYLALGPHRVGAAVTHVARLAAAGERVHVVIPGLPQWNQVTLADGAVVHRVATDPRRAVQAARRLVLDRSGPLAGAQLLVVGDLESVPVAWAARRQRPDLPIRFEPGDAGHGAFLETSTGPAELSTSEARRPAEADLAVVTPWYPSPNSPLSGGFVRTAVGALGGKYGRVSVLHTEEWSLRPSSPLASLVTVTLDRIAAQVDATVVGDRVEGEVTRVAVPFVAGASDHPARAAAYLDALRSALPTGRIEAPVVYAYGGLTGGVAAANLARPDARLVLVEGSPLLARTLLLPGTRKLYERVVQRADEVICVDRQVLDVLADHFPAHAARMRVVPNLVDGAALPLRTEPPEPSLGRVLHVGPLTARKGVSPVLEAFAKISKSSPGATMSVVDTTAATPSEIVDRVRQLKLRERVTFLSSVPDTGLAGLLAGHDLLVHGAQTEEFGTPTVEALATGTPVLALRHPETVEALADVPESAAVLVEPVQGGRNLTLGYRQLRDSLHRFDAPATRAMIQGRYGVPELLPRLLPDPMAGSSTVDVPEPTPAGPDAVDSPTPAPAIAVPAVPSAPPADAERVVLVAINATRFDATRSFALRAAAAGLVVDVITSDPNLWQQAARNPWLRIHAVDVAESRRPVLWTEQLLVYRAPGKMLAVARDQARRKQAVWPELGVLTAQRAHRKFVKLVHNAAFERGYRIVRPRIMWRIVRRDVLPKLDLSRSRQVVVAGPNGLTVGWHLARRNPDIPVTTSLAGYEQRKQ